MENEKCCVVVCDNPLDQNYWDAQYQSNKMGWDLGQVSPPLKMYIDSIQNKNCKILIPGCGNSYEANYLLEQGFTNVTLIDIAPTLVENLQQKHKDNPNIKIVLGDFFEHKDTYDLILEQTFFCALPPTMRQKYVWKMHHLLNENGILAGLLFDKEFEEGPPFGGNQAEYQKLFQNAFDFLKFEKCNHSIAPRLGSELFFEFQKNPNAIVNLYSFEGITCSGCMKTVTEKFTKMESVKNVSMSTDFSNVLVVSEKEIPLEFFQNEIAYDSKYKIKLLTH